MGDNKFEFGLEFQDELIRFVLCNDDGYKALEFIKNTYFTTLSRSVLFYAIERHWGTHSRVPTLPFILEHLKDIFSERIFAESLSEEDRKEITELSYTLTNKAARDGDLLLEAAAKFASYVELKSTIEDVDLSNFSSYPGFSSKVQDAINTGNIDYKEEEGLFLIKGLKDRQVNRQARDIVIPTPFAGMNRLTSAGGYEPGAMIVILDRPKRLKTNALVNISRGYLSTRKKVLVFDLENGQESWTVRLEQSVGRVTKKEIIKGTKDKEVAKIIRRYNRLGGEVHVKRLPGGCTVNHMQAYIDRVYRDHGIRFDVLIVDYIGLMNSKSGRTDDNGRIGDSFMDVANLVAKNKFDHCYTAHHVRRESYKKESTKYTGSDIAKSIDITRHVDAIYGLNRTPEEKENGIVRWEIVEQRDGVPEGRVFFYTDVPTQRMDELTKRQIDELTREGILYSPERWGEEESEENQQGDLA
jgi:hypothetical protein